MLLESLLALVLSVGWETHGPELPYVTQVAVSAADDRRVYAIGNDYPKAAIFRSDDAGQTWRWIFGRIFQAPSGEFLGTMQVDPANPDRLFTCTHRNEAFNFTTWLYRSIDGGETWTVQLTVDAITCSVAFDAAHPNNVYAAFSNGPQAFFFRSKDGGDSFESSPAPPFVEPQDLQVAPDGSILAMPSGWRSRDGGQTWQMRISLPDDCPITSLAIDPDNPDRMFATQGWNRTLCGAVLRSSDGGRTWFRFDTRGPAYDVVIDPLNPSVVYVSVGPADFNPPRVLFSSDGGSWQDLGLPDDALGVSDLALTGSGGRLYAATAAGAYTTTFRWTDSIYHPFRQTHAIGPRP